MRIWSCLPLVLSLGANLAAQSLEKWLVEPVLPEDTRTSQMYAYVDAHIPPLPRFHSVTEWENYKAQLRPRILHLLGIDDILAKHTLKVIRRGLLDGDGYSIEKINYESYPGMYVPAVVYIPKGLTGKAPAMISISGHNYCESKASRDVQAINYNLVRRGFIVLAYDYFACFERSSVDPCQAGDYASWDHLNSLFSYTSRTPTGIEVLDGIRALDYLYSRTDVDRARIGFTGASGGGNSTYWVSALDERVTLSVPVSSATSYDWWIKADMAWDHHQRPTGLRAFADIATLYAMAAPRPLLIINGRPELASMALPAALRSFEYVRAIYRLYGMENHTLFRETTTTHGYYPDKRALLYSWLDRWFFAGKMPLGTAELPLQQEPKENLRVGLPAESLNVPQLLRRWLDETPREFAVPGNLAAAHEFQNRKRAQLESLLARKAPLQPPAVIYRYGDNRLFGDRRAERLIFEMEPDLLVPAIFVRKQGRPKYKTIILLEKHRANSAEARSLLDRGYALLLLDVRGTGEVNWGGTRTSNWANFVGRPPMGMWAEDVSRVVTYLLGREDVQNVAVLGYGLFGKVALYAAALDERIAAAALSMDTLSYRQEATSGLQHVYADVPHILDWGDTPQLAALVAPRPLAILSAGLPVSANNEQPSYFMAVPRFAASDASVNERELGTNYEWTRRFYRTCGAERNLKIGMQDSNQAKALVEWFTTSAP
jgi:dienelactone hydrolase